MHQTSFLARNCPVMTKERKSSWTMIFLLSFFPVRQRKSEERKGCQLYFCRQCVPFSPAFCIRLFGWRIIFPRPRPVRAAQPVSPTSKSQELPVGCERVWPLSKNRNAQKAESFFYREKTLKSYFLSHCKWDFPSFGLTRDHSAVMSNIVF